MVLLCVVISLLISQMSKKKCLKAKLQHIEEDIFTSCNCTKLQIENNHLKLLLNNFTLMSAKNTQLSLLLNKTLEEKTQLEVENKGLTMFQNATLELAFSVDWVTRHGEGGCLPLDYWQHNPVERRVLDTSGAKQCHGHLGH